MEWINCCGQNSHAVKGKLCQHWDRSEKTKSGLERAEHGTSIHAQSQKTEILRCPKRKEDMLGVLSDVVFGSVPVGHGIFCGTYSAPIASTAEKC